MAKPRRVSPPASSCALREPRKSRPGKDSLPPGRGGAGPRLDGIRFAVHGSSASLLPDGARRDDDITFPAPTPVQQVQSALLRLEAVRSAGPPAGHGAFARELDLSMHRIGQLNSTISLLENLRKLLQSSCQ